MFELPVEELIYDVELDGMEVDELLSVTFIAREFRVNLPWEFVEEN